VCVDKRQLAAVCTPLAALGIEQHVLLLQPEHMPKSALTDFFDEQCVPCSNAHVLLLRTANRAAVPWIAFHHGVTAEDWRARCYHAIDRIMLRCADEVVVVSESQRAHVQGARRVNVIPNVVIHQQMHSALRSMNLRVASKHAPLVLYVGRLSYEKAVDVLLDAWPAVRAEYPQATLRIVGDGPARRLLEMHPAVTREGGSMTFAILALAS